MKPLREKDIDRTDGRWCRIYYITKSGYGSYIIKYNVLENNKKKFDKLLKDCVSVGIDSNYKPNMYDFIESALRTIRDKISYYEHALWWYRREPTSKEYRSLMEMRNINIQKQIRLERMLNNGKKL